MIESARKDRNRGLLQQCHPAFRARLVAAIVAVEAQSFRPRLQCAWRSAEDEETAFREGHSHVRTGFHNITGAKGVPEALAADVLDDDHPLSPSRAYVLALARAALAQGLATGIEWGLLANTRAALDTAIKQAATLWTGPIGFDPTHVEVTGITIAQALAGVRPELLPTEGLKA